MFSCGGTPSSPTPAPAPPPPVDAGPKLVMLPPDGPVPVARTGDLPPTEVKLPTLHVTKRFVRGDTETLLVPLDAKTVQTDAPDAFVVVHANDRAPSFAFYSPGAADGGGDGKAGPCLWIRRALTDDGKALDGTIAVPASDSYAVHAGQRLTFHIDADVTPGAVDPAAASRWATAAAVFFGQRAPYGDDFSAFASERMMKIAGKEKTTKSSNVARARRGGSSDEFSVDLDVMSGNLAITSALALESPGAAARGAAGKNVSAASVQGFTLPPHPWAQMGHASAASSPAPKPEPLAALTPAEFYYLRAKDTPTLELALDQMDTWGTAAERVVPGGHNDDYQLAASYQMQLGLVRSAQSKLIGGAAIGQVALVGSDVYLSEGSDLSLIFEVKSRDLFDAAMTEALARQEKSHAAASTPSAASTVNESARSYADVTITVSATGDGAIHRERADLGNGFVVFSNSPNALNRILDTAKGNHPALAAEPDFSYVLARDAGTPDGVFTFLGDRFLTAMTSPRARILEGRRRIAAAELTIPAYAALLYGWLEERSPKTTGDLIKAGLLDKKELTHSALIGGGAIAFEPEAAPSSTWGKPGAMVPLIDLPSPATYTANEASAYAQFANYYRSMWSDYVDPVAVRMDVMKGKMSIDLRQLPVPTLSEYRDLGLLAGDTRVSIPSGGDGLRFTMAIGRDSHLRREASSFLGNFTEEKNDLLGWLGDSITVGVLDRSVLASSVRELTNLPEPPLPADAGATGDPQIDGDLAAIAALPLYASIDVQNPVTAALVLAIGRKQIEHDLSDAVHWEDGGKEGAASITRIRVDQARDIPAFSIYYAIADGALDVALDEAVLRTVIRARKAGDRATTSHSSDTGAQHVLELASEPHDGLSTALAWLLASGFEASADYGARFEAEAYFRGIPEHAKDPELLGAIAQLYTGGQPRSQDDAQYHWSDEGVVDPAHGTFAHLRWPTLPVADSPMAKVLQSIARLRTEISFDDESGSPAKTHSGAPANATARLRSLHARATFVLR